MKKERIREQLIRLQNMESQSGQGFEREVRERLRFTGTSVAIMGDDERYKTIHIETNEYRGGAYGSLLGGAKLIGVSKRFQTFGEQLKQVLEEFDFEVVEPEEMNRLLSFKTKVPTIYRESRDYTVADAIFYWED